jgi:hypothetical protein
LTGFGVLSAQEAVFTEVNGKVEYRVPGAAWKPARVGDKVGKGTVVSTGFKSVAELKLGTATITLKPVTRLTLEEIVNSRSGTQTRLYLLAGRVKADVPPQTGQTIDFRVKSPTATASVRGTGFEFDGVNLIVTERAVRLQSFGGQFRFVKAGEFSYVNRNDQVMTPAAVMVERGLDRVDELIDQSGADLLGGNADTGTLVTDSDDDGYITADSGPLVIILK